MELQSHWYIAGDTVSHSRRFDCWTAGCENMKSCTAVGISIWCHFLIESKLKFSFKDVLNLKAFDVKCWCQMDNFLMLLLLSVTVSVCFPSSWHATLFVRWIILMFFRIVGNHSTQLRMVTSQKNGVLTHKAFKTSTLDVNVITNGCFRCSTVRIVT